MSSCFQDDLDAHTQCVLCGATDAAYSMELCGACRSKHMPDNGRLAGMNEREFVREAREQMYEADARRDRGVTACAPGAEPGQLACTGTACGNAPLRKCPNTLCAPCCRMRVGGVATCKPHTRKL